MNCQCYISVIGQGD